MEDGGELEGTFECSSRRVPRETPSPLERLRELQQFKDQQRKRPGAESRDEDAEPQPQQASGMASEEAGAGVSLSPRMASGEGVTVAVAVVGAGPDTVPLEAESMPGESETMPLMGGCSTSVPPLRHEQSPLRWPRSGPAGSLSSEEVARNLQDAGAAAAESPSWIR